MSDPSVPQRPTVLVVDDEPGILEMLTNVLATEGYGSVTAADGPTTIARLARDGVDLVLLDLTLPGMDGLAICRQVRAQASPAMPYLPILMLTARTEVA